MNALDAARRYIEKVPTASQGGRNDKLNQLAYGILERFELQKADYEDLLMEWAGACSPPIADSEVVKTLNSAWNAAQGKGAVGSKARKLSSHPSPSAKRLPEPKSDAKAVRYELRDDELPEPIPDGARALLRTAFESGEGVRIVKAIIGEDGNEIPEGNGSTIKQEDWLARLEKVKGNPNGIFHSTKKTGIYIAINPLRLGGTKDADVTVFRHALVEFDKDESGLSPENQWSLYKESKLPCTAVIFSGGQSVHAWVKVDAKDSREFAERTAVIFSHFKSAGYNLDIKNKNPSRLSRLPNCVRFERHQELLALNVGCESFTEWLTSLEADAVGESVGIKELDAFDSEHDVNNLIGKRWLCCGGSALLVGPSGIGKSSLAIQLGIVFSVGLTFFGITPVKPLKVLMIQAENDIGDLAEMVSGVRSGIGIDPFANESQYDLLCKNFKVVTDTTHAGDAFILSVRKLVERDRPDLLIIDPLLSFIGDDVSRQAVCSNFFRRGFAPIAKATGVASLWVHHTGKPSNDPKSRQHWRSHDYSYAGSGSSDLTNWARAIMVLEQAGDGAFRLMLPKRGRRACASHPDTTPTNTVWLKHAEKGIYWQQVDPPTEPEPKERNQKGGKPSKLDQIIGMNMHDFLAKCIPAGEGKNAISKRLEVWCSKNGEDISLATAKRAVERLASKPCCKLAKNDDSLYIKGPNA